MAKTTGGFFQQGKRKAGALRPRNDKSRKDETLRGFADRFRFDEATKVR
jgi:hypothetical protein